MQMKRQRFQTDRQAGRETERGYRKQSERGEIIEMVKEFQGEGRGRERRWKIEKL